MSSDVKVIKVGVRQGYLLKRWVERLPDETGVRLDCKTCDRVTMISLAARLAKP